MSSAAPAVLIASDPARHYHNDNRSECDHAIYDIARRSAELFEKAWDDRYKRATETIRVDWNRPPAFGLLHWIGRDLPAALDEPPELGEPP